MKRFLLFLTLCFASVALWAAPPKPLSIEEHNKLVQYRICLDNIGNFKEAGIMTAEAYDAAVKKCVDGARATLGREITMNEILQKVEPTWQLTTSQKVAGWVDTWSFMQILATIGVGICGAVFLFYAFPRLRAVPKELYEFMLYGLAVWMTFFGLTFGLNAYIMGFVGVILFVGAWTFTVKAHHLESDNPWFFFFVILVYSGIAAFLYQSTLIGYVSVIALLAMVGFIIHASGLGIAVGFKDKESVPTGTFVAFALVMAHLLMRAYLDEPYLAVFAPAAFWVGSIVFFLGLLIMSSKWYSHSGKFVLWNMLLPIMAIAAVFVGEFLGVPDLARVAGTMLVLWAVEKYVEVTMHGVLSASFFGLLGSGALLWFSNWALENSERVGKYLLFV